jgi:hypothetical protein
MTQATELIAKQMAAGSANARVWADILYNVKLYGAKGDGYTDDTAAVQATIDAVGSYGGTVYFPPGSYKVTSTIYIRKNNIILQGSGPDSTTIFAVGDYGDTFVIEPAAGQVNILSCGIENMRFYTATNTTNGAFIVCSMLYQAFFSNLIITEKFGGVLIKGGSNQSWSNINATTDALWSSVKVGSYLFKFTKYTGVTTLNPQPSEIFMNNMNLRGSSSNRYLENAVIVEAADGLWFDNGHIGFAAVAGIQVKHGGDDYTIGGLEVSNIWFDFCKYGVAYLDNVTAFAYNGYHAFSNCLFVGHTVNGFFCTENGLKGLSFAGCYFGRSQSHACQITSGSNISFAGCHFFDAADTDGIAPNNDTAGLWLEGTSAKVTVSGCQFYVSDAVQYTQEFGISLSGSFDTLAVSGCLFNGMVLADISDGSTGKNKKVTGSVSDKEIVSVSANGAGDVFLPITYDVFKITGANNIGSISAQTTVKGRRVTLIGTGVLSIFAANNLKIAGTFNVTDLDTITLVCDGTNWFEVSRVVN